MFCATVDPWAMVLVCRLDSWSLRKGGVIVTDSGLVVQQMPLATRKDILHFSVYPVSIVHIE